MLRFKISEAIFISIILLFITVPAVSFNNSNDNGGFPQKFIDSITAPKKPLNKQATLFVKKYIKENNKCLDLIKEKNASTFILMDDVLANYGIPIELKYLAVIESELNPKAVSRVGAAGPWQLMPATAKILGLKITRKYDERKNFKKSTKAAAIYLRDLYTEYGDWLLVLAAYNCGPGVVNGAIRKSGSRNFWKLQNYLPAESRGHVKKYIATHYYFEGQGSVTTLTKSENIKHVKAMAVWAANQEKLNNPTPLAVTDDNSLTDTTSKKTVVLN